jgi:DNA-binding transcriptional ArsR family regulator
MTPRSLPGTDVFQLEVRLDNAALSSSPQDVVRVLSALSDLNRFRIVELLSGDDVELACGAIGEELGMSPSLVSHHLSVLEGAGVIERRRNGLWTLNRLRRDELSRKLSGLHRILGGVTTPNGAD